MARKDEEDIEDDENGFDEDDEEKSIKKGKKSAAKQKAVFIPRAVPASEMFNIISDKLDMILEEMSKKD